ncbi:arrestin domain-containing protein 5-like isoform X1 [Euwallacea similis]|uniref:arrestin domain-containing protein 5-like isoform X1 n=2 Tax=Euwallacea similis TaxID=1736056 RepID=UPI00344C3603
MPQQCKLMLDNYTGQYLPGTAIQGRVLICLDSETSLRGVRLILTCKEHTEWMGTESYYDSEERTQKSRDTQFTGDRDVFEIKQWLYGDQNASTSLHAGQHMYPFQIILQQNIPGTYHSEKGSVSYKLKATLDRKMAFDYSDEFIIVINSPIDLNFIARPEDLQSTHYSDEKTVCCWCCAQGPITMDVELPKRTLIPGEQIDVTVYLSNLSNTNVENVTLELLQKLNFKVTNPEKDDKVEENTFVSLRDVGLGAHGENTYIFKVTLPPNVFLPNFTQCALFSVNYEYKIVAHLPSMHHSLEVKIFPSLGHIPLAASGQPPFSPGAPPEGELYPSMGLVGEHDVQPSAPLLDPKEQQFSGPGQHTNQGNFEPPPPSYDSLKWPS